MLELNDEKTNQKKQPIKSLETLLTEHLGEECRAIRDIHNIHRVIIQVYKGTWFFEMLHNWRTIAKQPFYCWYIVDETYREKLISFFGDEIII